MSETVLHLSDFEPHLNQVFTIRVDEEHVVEAELVEADRLENVYTLEDSPRKPFSLVFKLEEGAELPQRLYDVSCADLRWQNVFLVPIQVPRSGRYMQSIFN
jgi:hypothetical protein